MFLVTQVLPLPYTYNNISPSKAKVGRFCPGLLILAGTRSVSIQDHAMRVIMGYLTGGGGEEEEEEKERYEVEEEADEENEG